MSSESLLAIPGGKAMKRLIANLMIVIGLLWGVGVAAQQAAQGPVIVAEVSGVINPLTANYLERVLTVAERDQAHAIILVLDTPGGLESAMRDMVQMMLEAPLPVIVYVAPGGARATSAGLFLTMAGHVAAMAPATHIGAAHPVPLGMEIDDVMDEKMVSDAAALIRSIATTRGRNAEWGEQAVRENLSLTAAEALEIGVIDDIADSLEQLLADIDGRQITTAQGEVTLRTRGALVQRQPMTWMERLIHVITNPDIAYLLISLGTLLLLAEVADPGLSVAGVGSVVAFILAFTALGSLPINWAGVGLLLLALALFAFALFTDTEAIVTVAALVPFVLGSLLLFAPFTPSPPAAPALRVNPWLIGVMGASIAAFSLGILRAILRASKMPPQSGAQKLIGHRGKALTDLAPAGQARVDLENWSVVSLGRDIKEGEEIEVVGISGVRLQVRPVDPEA
jgi:membrane-bound serine protease (ClpP class)